MISADKPGNEKERIAALHEYDLLDTIPEKDYDDITHIAADICGVPISLITLIDNDRQWFKAVLGLDDTETSRDVAFCAHAILNPSELFIVADASRDERFHDNPLVIGEPNIGFYAGVPLVTNSGFPLGTLCVIDKKPNKLTREQQETLKALGRQVVAQFELRKLNRKLAEQAADLEQVNTDISRFAHVVAHDIKSPCSSISMAADYLKDAYGESLDETAGEMISLIEKTSHKVVSMIDGILTHTLAVNNSNNNKEEFTLGELVEETKEFVTIPAGFSVEAAQPGLPLFACRSMLTQVLLNLCNNAIKYNDKTNGSVIVSASDDGDHYTFSVKDNGPGIKPEDHLRIFDLFNTLGKKDRNNQQGTGIGLATVQRLVQKMDGAVHVESAPGQGSTFIFTVSK